MTGFNPPPVSETKAAFLHKYPRPLPGIYDTVIQELLVQQHLLRYQKKYEYDKVPVAGSHRRCVLDGALCTVTSGACGSCMAEACVCPCLTIFAGANRTVPVGCCF